MERIIKSIEKEQSNIKNMGKPTTKKAKKFLEMIKKEINEKA